MDMLQLAEHSAADGVVEGESAAMLYSCVVLVYREAIHVKAVPKMQIE